MDNNITFNLEELPISKNWKLVQAIGGKRLVHAHGCEWIKDWDISGFKELLKFKTDKHTPCPSCGYLCYITMGAKDYSNNWSKYKEYLGDASTPSIIKLYHGARAKTEWRGDRLYIRCRKDDWYIDFSLGEVHLYHNNYNVGSRERGNTAEQGGFHEHIIEKTAYESRLNAAIKDIIKYNFEKATEVHRNKSKTKQRMTFSEYDEEYWGLK